MFSEHTNRTDIFIQMCLYILMFVNRTFHLNLRQKHSLLSTDFKVVTVDKDGREKEVPFTADNFYEGYVYGMACSYSQI